MLVLCTSVNGLANLSVSGLQLAAFDAFLHEPYFKEHLAFGLLTSRC